MTGCVRQGEYIVENRRFIADAEGDIGDLGEAVLNSDTDKIKTVVLRARSKQLDLNKSADKIKEQLSKNWFVKMFLGIITFARENGGVLVEAGKNILMQNWGGLAMTAVAGGLEYYRRQEKNKKQEFASAVNEIAHETDEVKRKEKAKDVFVGKKKKT